MTKNTIVVGASSNPDRYSYRAVQMLQNHDIPVYAFGAKLGFIGKVKINTNLPETNLYHTISVYISPKNQDKKLIESIISLNPKRIIFNPGSENYYFVEKAKENGIETENSCTLVLLQTEQY